MISSIYTGEKLPAKTAQLLRQAIDKGLSRGHGRAEIFFRADDIGVPGQQFSLLAQLFRQYQLPLCLAVVPTWISKERFSALQRETGTDSSQWCWHQHGWLHRNHESKGKKQEFGPARSGKKQVEDLKKGQKRLQTILGSSFSPFFTPPWNRCSLETLEGLKLLNFQAVSRSKNAQPAVPAGLADLQINIDLHTRKEPDPEECFTNLLSELSDGIAAGRGGIMIHHQRMNPAAFDFLSLLLQAVTDTPSLHPALFQELLQ